jgi:hypothetical protein
MLGLTGADLIDRHGVERETHLNNCPHRLGLMAYRVHVIYDISMLVALPGLNVAAVGHQAAFNRGAGPQSTARTRW